MPLISPGQRLSVVASFRQRVVPLAILIASVVSIAGCRSGAPPSSSTRVAGVASAFTYPKRPSTAPPAFKLFHHDASTFTLVTKDDASDTDIEAIIWQLRDAAHARSLDKLGISEKAIADHKPTAWFHIYRGAKCAAEKYAPGDPPCGGSYHAAGDYTFGSSVNPAWDDGILHTPDGKELPLWDSEATYKP